MSVGACDACGKEGFRRWVGKRLYCTTCERVWCEGAATAILAGLSCSHQIIDAPVLHDTPMKAAREMALVLTPDVSKW